jgi:hypothetical protein
MEPFGHRESSLFAEPTENKSFSERNPVFFSTKLEMIRKGLLPQRAQSTQRV